MADENRNVESFALGLIVAIIAFLLIRRELRKKAGGGCGCQGADAGADVSRASRTCKSDTLALLTPDNPRVTGGITLAQKGGTGWTFERTSAFLDQSQTGSI